MSIYKSNTLGISSGGDVTEVIDDTGDGNQTRDGPGQKASGRRLLESPEAKEPAGARTKGNIA